MEALQVKPQFWLRDKGHLRTTRFRPSDLTAMAA
jgi:hypothetical protein